MTESKGHKEGSAVIILGNNGAAVTQAMMEVARRFLACQQELGYLSTLEIYPEQTDGRPEDNQAEYFTVVGEIHMFDKPDRTYKVIGNAKLWWHDNARTLSAVLKYWKGEYRVLASDAFRSSEHFLEIWRTVADFKETPELMVDTIDRRSGLRLVRDMAELRSVAGSYLPMKVEVLLKSGDYRVGNLSGFEGDAIVMDFCGTTITPAFSEIEAMWTDSPQEKASAG